MAENVVIIIVTHYSADHLATCLDSIPAASSSSTPTIIVDNDTVDGSVAEVVGRYPTVKLIDAGSNLGYGRAINLAAKNLPPVTEWILIANPDTVFRAGSIDPMLATGESDGRVAAVGPKIVDPDGTTYPSARSQPSLRTGVGHALFARLWPANPWTARYLGSVRTEAADPGWLSGACVLVRRSAFEAVGGFDQRYFMYFEDVDLGRRLGSAGWLNRYDPVAVVEHTGGQSTKRYSRQMLRVHHQSAYVFLADKYSGWYLWPLRVVLRVGLWMRSRLAR